MRFIYNINSKPLKNATIKIEPDYRIIRKIIKNLKEIQEITEIWRLSGDYGLLLKVEYPTIEYLNHLVEEKIGLIEGIKIIKTCSIIQVIK